MNYSVRASVNSFILILITVSCTLYQTDLGGEGSLYNTISFLLASAFVFLNFRFNQFLFLFFLLPLFMLLLSFTMNANALNSGGIHTILSIFVSYLLLTVSNFKLNNRLINQFMTIYLWIMLILSAFFSIDYFLSGNFYGSIANANFNGNPNAASLFFFECLILTYIFIRGKVRWFFILTFFTWILTTASRAGFITAIMLLSISGFWDAGKARLLKRQLFSFKKMTSYFLLLTIFLGGLYNLFPESFMLLKMRLSAVGFGLSTGNINTHGRDEIWGTAFEISNSSLKNLLVGTGPNANEMKELTTGLHSSYVELMFTMGSLFLIATLIFIGGLFHYHKRRGEYYCIFFACLILFYGIFESVLFHGITSLWWLFIFLSLYCRSNNLNDLIEPQESGHLMYADHR